MRSGVAAQGAAQGGSSGPNAGKSRPHRRNSARPALSSHGWATKNAAQFSPIKSPRRRCRKPTDSGRRPSSARSPAARRLRWMRITSAAGIPVVRRAATRLGGARNPVAGRMTRGLFLHRRRRPIAAAELDSADARNWPVSPRAARPCAWACLGAGKSPFRSSGARHPV
jgi:hypothetical protein